MNGTISDGLKSLGLSDRQIGELTALQERGRGIDFRYHFTDDGRDPLRIGRQIDEFSDRLRTFAAEGETPRQFAAALWDHVTPRFVGWKPDYAEDVEFRHLTHLHVRLDHEIDARLGWVVPQEVRTASQDVRERFDNLVFAYEAGTWRDTRTPSEVRDELLFVASLDEKIRGVLYNKARAIDLMQVIADADTTKSVGRDLALEPSFEARAYTAQLARVGDILDRLKGAGVEIRTGLKVEALAEHQSRGTSAQTDEPGQTRTAARANKVRLPLTPRPTTDANAYWRGVADKVPGAALSPTQSLTPSARRGRTI